MPALKVRCPHCQQNVRVNTNGQHEVVQMTCPLCGRASKFRVPRHLPTSPQQPSNPDSLDPLSLLSPDELRTPASANWEKGLPQPSTWNRPQGNSGNRRAKPQKNYLFFGAVGAAVVVVCGLVAGAAFFWTSQEPTPINPGATTAASDGTSVSPVATLPTLADLPRPDSVDQIQQELLELIGKADQSVAALTDGELQTAGADRLEELEPQFRDLFLRAAQATPKPLTMTDMAAQDAKFAAMIAGAASGNNPPRNHLWSLDSNTSPSDRWGAARNAISQAKIRTEMALQSRVKLPDPLVETSGAYDWSPESRRVLSAYWLQGELERDVITEMIAGLREGESEQEFQDRCFAAIERFYQPARELAAVTSTQGSLVISEPVATPYARHASATRYTLKELQREFTEETVAWTIGQTIYFSDAIEELQFGRTAKVTSLSGRPVRERFEKVKAIREQERQEKLAKEERDRLEKERQEAARQAKIAAEQERERQLAEAAKAKAEDPNAASNPQSPQSLLAGGGPSGPGSGRGPQGMGRGRERAARFAAPEAPTDPGTRTGTPPPEFGPPPTAGPTLGPNGRGQPERPSLGPSVTIRVTGSGKLDVPSYLEKLKTALKTGNYQTSQSGNAATIKLGFAGDLQTVVDAIDFGKVESTDPENREIRVVID